MSLRKGLFAISAPSLLLPVAAVRIGDEEHVQKQSEEGKGEKQFPFIFGNALLDPFDDSAEDDLEPGNSAPFVQSADPFERPLHRSGEGEDAHVGGRSVHASGGSNMPPRTNALSEESSDTAKQKSKNAVIDLVSNLVQSMKSASAESEAGHSMDRKSTRLNSSHV
eukprot:TRINITY_DN5712_c0_g1_i1.p1 TRINITY_DN5712_c0_g1~~TRINITY_DN5712_c0_g1_i1.p1  ORF type:complete len:166 (+),score=37.58 TRINITY_DN5712_c0_g1_i1:89-586(+)